MLPASLIDRLYLEATPHTPDVSPFASAQRSLMNHKSTATLESPLTRTKRLRTTTGSPLRMGLNRASTTSSVVSLHPYAERKSTSPKLEPPEAEMKKPRSGNEHLVGQHISSWEDLNWNVLPIKKVKAPSPSTRPTHKCTLSPPAPFDPPLVFQPLHPPKNRIPSNPKSTKSSPEMRTMKLRPSTPPDGNKPPQVPTSTFGQWPNKISCNGPGASGGLAPVPVFSRSHSRNKCHRYGRLCDYRSTLFFISLSPTLRSHSLILSFILSYLFTYLLSHLTHLSSHSFPHVLYLPFKCAEYFDDVRGRNKKGTTTVYSYTGG